MKRPALLLLFVLGVIGGLLPSLPFVREVEWSTVDWRFRVRGPIATSQPVVVVVIDDAAERRWKDVPQAMWGTERGKILAQLNEMGVQRVGLDLVIGVDTDAYLATRGGETPNTDFASVIAEMGDRVFMGTSTGHDWADLFVFASDEHLASVNQGETSASVVRSVPRLDTFMTPPLPGMAAALSGVKAQGPVWINYSGQRPASIPALDILDGKVDEKEIRGKIVLIGETHQYTKDRTNTPFAKEVAGVYIQAEAVESVLNKRELRFLDGWWVSLIGVLLAVSAGLLALLGTPLRYAFVTGLIGLAWLGLTGWAFSSHNFVVPLFSPLLLGLVVPAIAFPYRAFEEQGARAVMGQMMSEKLFQRFQQNGGGDGVLGELVGSFLFLDIEDFSRKSNELPPEEFLAGMNQVLSHATTIIERYGGDVVTFVGDGLCAVFEAGPGEDGEAARRKALDSGQELIRQVPVSVPGKVRWNVRVGLAWGEATVAVAGSDKRKQVSVYGSAVNLASRLEQAGKELGSSMCVESSAFATLATEFESTQVIVKGWSEPVEVLFAPSGSI